MVLNTGNSVFKPRSSEALDVDSLGMYLSRHLPGFEPSSLQIFKFSHGQSNPTFLIKSNVGAYVLRKKPPPPTLPSAHAIEREYTVLAALAHTPVPVPRAVHFCEDSSVIGTPFYIMSHVQGRIFTDPALPDLPPIARTTVYQALASTLAALHSIRPQDVGLVRYGPASRYNARQVSRWSRQYVKSVAPGAAPMHEMVELGAALQRSIPSSDADPTVTRISHGDYRLDNLVFHPERVDTVLALLDWELSTLGDPWADVAYCCLAYHLQRDSVTSLPALPYPLPQGIPDESEFVGMYCQARGIGPPNPSEWRFYLALSLFRLAAILAGVGARAKAGNASSRIAAEVGADDVVRPLADGALAILGEKEKPASIVPDAIAPSKEHTGDQAHLGLGPSERVASTVERLHKFMEEMVYPAEATLNAHAASDARWSVHPLQERLKEEAKAAGLWNLWIPPDMVPRLLLLLSTCNPPLSPVEVDLLVGPSLTNLEYSHCAEVMGRSVWAPECFNCSAPDTGNMEVLARYGSVEQQCQWLLPLLQGQIRSCFAMTEPAVASSDATNIEGSIQRDRATGDYIVEGRKWWISGATDPRCEIAIFMGKTDPTAAPHKQQTMILVPLSAPGVHVIRPLPVFGYDDAPHGHAEIDFRGVRVPASNVILGEGRGFEIAQGRLGPGRLHHCMRLIGMGERALMIMTQRTLQRVAFGKPLAGHQSVRLDIARSRIELDAARLVVLEAARALDEVGNKAARGKIAAAKALTPTTVLSILDRAIQVHGGAGVSDCTPLAGMWAGARTLRLADGPDVVHLETIAKLELSRHRRSRL